MCHRRYYFQISDGVTFKTAKILKNEEDSSSFLACLPKKAEGDILF